VKAQNSITIYLALSIVLGKALFQLIFFEKMKFGIHGQPKW